MYNDYELLYLAQENNEDAVNELRKKYNSLLYAKALSYSRSSHIDIKELLNETELAFYKAIDNYIDKNTFNTYLNKVIDNNLTNYIAKHNVTKNKILNDTLDSVLSIVEENGDSVIDNFGIILDSSGSYQFAETNETSRLRMEKVLLMILQKKKKIRQPSRSYIIYANDTDWIIPNMMPHIF